MSGSVKGQMSTISGLRSKVRCQIQMAKVKGQMSIQITEVKGQMSNSDD